MDCAAIIKQQLGKIGSTAYLNDGEWSSTPFSAVVQHLWRKKSSNFEYDVTELGKVDNEYYLYIGPANHNIKALSENATLDFNGDRYVFKRRDEVSIKGEAVYYTGILKKIGEAEG